MVCMAPFLYKITPKTLLKIKCVTMVSNQTLIVLENKIIFSSIYVSTATAFVYQYNKPYNTKCDSFWLHANITKIPSKYRKIIRQRTGNFKISLFNNFYNNVLLR